MKTIAIRIDDDAFMKVSDLAVAHKTTIMRMAELLILSKLGVIGDMDMKEEVGRK